MVCLDCLKTERVPSCTQNLDIGSIGSNNTDIYIYVKDVTARKLHRFSVDGNNQQLQSGASGEVVLPMDTKFVWMQDHYYEVWVTLKTATSMEDREVITIDSETTECVVLNIYEVYKQNSDMANDYSNLTLAPSE